MTEGAKTRLKKLLVDIEVDMARRKRDLQDFRPIFEGDLKDTELNELDKLKTQIRGVWKATWKTANALGV